MINDFKIDTTKKRFAFEIIVVISTILICSVLYYVGNYYEKLKIKQYYEYEQVIKPKIDSLSDNVFRNRYLSLYNNNRIDDYTYESYKKKILNDTDSSFQRDIYYRLCNIFPFYSNEKTFEEFSKQFEYNTINEIDEQLINLQKQSEKISKEYPESNDTYIKVILLLIIIIYPLRFIYYLLRWSLNTLKGTDKLQINEKLHINNSTINDSKSSNNIFENKSEEIKKNEGILNDNEKQDEIKTTFKNYFIFDNEYLTGISYLTRMLVGLLTSWILGFGFFLMIPTIYKRSKSLGLKKSICIFNCFSIIISFILNIVIRETERSFGESDDYLMKIIPFVLSIPHFILLFKNGTRKKIGKFQVRY